MRPCTILILILPIFLSCGDEPAVTKELFGRTPDGRDVHLYTLRNASGMEAAILNYGGIVVSLLAPDREGNPGDIVLGFDSLDAYLENSAYFGCIIGRYCNRIGKGKFVLNNVEYSLATNNGENHLHGGIRGFDKLLWEARTLATDEGPSLALLHVSPEGDEGYPGNLTVEVVYTLTNRNELKISYRATTDKPTIVNLTHHSYFNLSGTGDILAHGLMIDADFFTPVDAGLIPTGDLRPVDGTPMDFRKMASIGSRIDMPDEQLVQAGGYDHNWVLNKNDNSVTSVARVFEPTTGRSMEVLTSEPGLQFYSGNFLDGSLIGKKSRTYGHRAGFCLETQHFPDAPNKPHFPTTILNPGDTYFTTTIYRFSVR